MRSHGSSSKGKGASPQSPNALMDHMAGGTAVFGGLFPLGAYLPPQAQTPGSVSEQFGVGTQEMNNTQVI